MCCKCNCCCKVEPTKDEIKVELQRIIYLPENRWSAIRDLAKKLNLVV